MKLSIKKTVVAVSAAALVLGLTGCTDQERAFFQAFCAAQPGSCMTVPASDPIGVERLEATVVLPNHGPAPLQTWIADSQMSDEPDSAYLSAADGTYITIAGGLRPTGGYRVEVSEAVREGEVWVVDARVISPDPGSVVTMAMTNPSTLVRFPSLHGPITVRLTEAPGNQRMIKATELTHLVDHADITAETTWMPDSILNVTGNVLLDLPDPHFEVLKGSVVLAQSDAQVKDTGYYVTNLIVEGGATEGLTMVISSVAPGGGRILLTRDLTIE